MEIIGLFSGVLLFSVLCLLPEVRARTWFSIMICFVLMFPCCSVLELTEQFLVMI